MLLLFTVKLNIKMIYKYFEIDLVHLCIYVYQKWRKVC